MSTYPNSVGESGCIQSNIRSASSKLAVGADIAGHKCYKLWLHTCNSAQAGLLQGSCDDPRSLEQGGRAIISIFFHTSETAKPNKPYICEDRNFFLTGIVTLKWGKCGRSDTIETRGMQPMIN